MLYLGSEDHAGGTVKEVYRHAEEVPKAYGDELLIILEVCLVGL